MAGAVRVSDLARGCCHAVVAHLRQVTVSRTSPCWTGLVCLRGRSLRDYNFPADSTLHADLQRLATDYPGGVDHIQMEVLFPPRYPVDPPFVRVVYPRFRYHTGTVEQQPCQQHDCLVYDALPVLLARGSCLCSSVGRSRDVGW